MTYCHATAQLNRYQRQIDNECAREQAIDDRASLLLDNEYDPCIAENFLEGFYEIEASDVAKLAKLAELASFEYYHGLGKALFSLIYDYWEKTAKSRATILIDRGENDY